MIWRRRRSREVVNSLAERPRSPKPCCIGKPGRELRVGAVILAVISLGMVAMVGRVVQLKVAPPPRVAALLGTQRRMSEPVARRGGILDRNGRVIASSSLATRLFVDPGLVDDPDLFSRAVAEQLGYDADWLMRKITERPGRRYVVIDAHLDETRLSLLSGFRLRGLATERFVYRSYPHGGLGGQVLGFVGKDGQGLEGLELVLDRALAGESGKLSYLCDSRRRFLWVEDSGYRPPLDGRDLRLTLDLVIQDIADAELRRACQEFDAPSGQLIVIEPRTGQVLAMANYPGFDPTRLAKSTGDDRRNRCVTDLFEPGSTFKPFIWASAVSQRVADSQEVIDCTDAGFYVSPRGRRLRDTKGHGRLTFEQVLVHSSNIGMAIVGQRMSSARLYQALRDWGFGSQTGIELSGEAAGIVHPLKRWNHYSETSIPMGQEVAVTPLQLAAAFCAIANGGYRVKPTVVLPTTRVQRASEMFDESRRIISADAAALTRRALSLVVSDPHGTGRRANSDLYPILGKTGTAQVPDPVNGGYLEGQYISSFLAAAPAEVPRLVVACVVHRPDRSKGYYGGTVAAPAARRVIERALMYLGHPPVSSPARDDDLRYAHAGH